MGRGEHTRNRKPKGIREFSKESLQQSRLSSSRWSRYYHRTKLLHCIWSIGMFVVVLRGGCFAISSGKKSYQRWLPLSRLGSKKTEIGVCSREKLRGNQADNSSKKKKNTTDRQNHGTEAIAADRVIGVDNGVMKNAADCRLSAMVSSTYLHACISRD